MWARSMSVSLWECFICIAEFKIVPKHWAVIFLTFIGMWDIPVSVSLWECLICIPEWKTDQLGSTMFTFFGLCLSACGNAQNK